MRITYFSQNGFGVNHNNTNFSIHIDVDPFSTMRDLCNENEIDDLLQKVSEIINSNHSDIARQISSLASTHGENFYIAFPTP